jgi:hypothetical protein
LNKPGKIILAIAILVYTAIQLNNKYENEKIRIEKENNTHELLLRKAYQKKYDSTPTLNKENKQQDSLMHKELLKQKGTTKPN